MVGARLEGDIERPSPGPFTRLIERDDLGVGRAGALVPSLADDIPLRGPDSPRSRPFASM